MTRLVSLANITSPDYNQQHGDYLQVSILWTSGLPKANNSRETVCRFIFGDGESVLMGIIYCQSSNARNVIRQLQDKTCQWKIKNFTVKHNVEERFQMKRGHSKQIVLRPNLDNIEKLTSTTAVNSCLPYDFVKLDDIARIPRENIIDVVGYATEIGKTEMTRDKKSKIKEVTICAARANNPNKTGYEIVVKIYGDLTEDIKRKNCVYAFLNLKVQDFMVRGESQKTLVTVRNTVITKIDNVENLPAVYREYDYILSLFPMKRPKRDSETAKRANTYQNILPNAPKMEQPGTSKALNPYLPPPQDSPYSPRYTPGQYTRTYWDPLNLNAPSPQSPGQPPQTPGQGMPYSPSRAQRDSPSSVDSKRFRPSPSPQPYGSPCSSVSTNSPAPTYAQVSGGSSGQMKKPQAVKVGEYDAMARFKKKDYDFINNYQPLKVTGNVIPALEYMDNKPNKYGMRANPRGIALIINNHYFPHKNNINERNRKGSDKDVKYLTENFQAYKFQVFIKEDVASWELDSVLRDFKQEARESMDACFIAILSHGVHGLIEMVDGSMVRLHNDIIHPFDENLFPVMAGKPKIFVVQACQDIPSTGETANIQEIQPNREDDIDLKNMIVCYPTAPGTSAGRDEELGSHYIYVLVDTLMENSHNTDFVTMLDLVQYRLRYCVKRCADYKLHSHYTKFGFNKKLYFNPGK